MGGGYKGYALMLLLEVLTGSLIRSMLSCDMDKNKFIPEQHGALLLTLDIASFTSVNNFKKEVGDMCNRIRSLKAAPYVQKVMVPGDASYKRASTQLKLGSVEVDDGLWLQLQEMV